MVIALEHVLGQTPLDPDDLAGLKIQHITTQAQLNEYEQLNIVDGQQWGLRQTKKNILDEAFVRLLHKKMFGHVWKWAGTFRHSDKNIGVAWAQVGQRLNQLLGNVAYQMEHGAYPPDEIGVRFHHQLVWIHPFPNGNGRHARLMADLLAVKMGHERFSWGRANLVDAGQARETYIRALQAADQQQYEALMRFARG